MLKPMCKGRGGSKFSECLCFTPLDFPFLQLKRIVWEILRQLCDSSKLMLGPFKRKEMKYFRLVGREFCWQFGGK